MDQGIGAETPAGVHEDKVGVPLLTDLVVHPLDPRFAGRALHEVIDGVVGVAVGDPDPPLVGFPALRLGRRGEIVVGVVETRNELFAELVHRGRGIEIARAPELDQEGPLGFGVAGIELGQFLLGGQVDDLVPQLDDRLLGHLDRFQLVGLDRNHVTEHLEGPGPDHPLTGLFVHDLENQLIGAAGNHVHVHVRDGHDLVRGPDRLAHPVLEDLTVVHIQPLDRDGSGVGVRLRTGRSGFAEPVDLDVEREGGDVQSERAQRIRDHLQTVLDEFVR